MAQLTKMTPEAIKAKTEELVRALKEKGITGQCPRCGRNDWQASLFGYFVSALPVEGVTIPPPHIPILNLTCNNCGSTQLHNLNVLGMEL